jgi:hypothetical protein
VALDGLTSYPTANTSLRLVERISQELQILTLLPLNGELRELTIKLFFSPILAPSLFLNRMMQELFNLRLETEEIIRNGSFLGLDLDLFSLLYSN